MTNAARSIAFYVEKLGFKIEWRHTLGPDYPVFAHLTRQGQNIFLTEHTGDCQVGGAVYFVVSDAAQCYAEFEQQCIVATNRLATTPWGTKEFLVEDTDGNRLRFAPEVTG